jgi:N-acyl-D-amino-acid deacylase
MSSSPELPPRTLGRNPSADHEDASVAPPPAATIRHTNVCPVYGVGVVEGVPYLTMGYIEGKSLADWLHAKPLTPRQSAMRRHCGCVVLLSAIVLLGLSASGRAQTLRMARHGLTWEAFRAWDKGEAKDYRLTYLNGYDTGGSARYAAVAVEDGKGLESRYEVSHSLDTLRKKDQVYRSRGLRPICVTGYLDGRSPEFAALWVADRHPAQASIAWNLSKKEYTDRLNREKKNNFMPKMTTGYADGAGSYRFTALFVPAGKTLWEEEHNLTEARYQKALDDYKAKGFRPSSVTAYPTPSGLRFAGIFLKDGRKSHARYGLSAGEYQTEFEGMAKDGFHPVSIAGYVVGKAVGLDIFDQTMGRFMTERGIKAGTLAVSRAGKLLLARGYGVEADTPMRLASVTKPITAAAIHTLIREGKLTLDTKVFPLLGLKPPPGRKADSRLNDITIRHLLEHKGGWDRAKAFDPMFRPLEISAALKSPPPAGPVDIIRYMMGQPLQFDPGAKVSYSNFGYCVLGRVIEKVSGQTYPSYVQKRIFAPLGARSVELGRTLPKHRNPREPVYVDSGKGRNVLDPRSKEEVPAPDGTFYLEAMDAHGGLIASSTDLIRFLDAYWITGEKREGAGRSAAFFGRFPGTFTMVMQRPNGVNVAALFNQERDPSGLDYFKIGDAMQEAADRPSGGEVRYAAVWVKSK